MIGGTAAADNVAEGANSNASDKKMFFTTSDLLERMNSAIAEANPDGLPGAEPSGGFELQRKMPDGSYRRAGESEVAAADFQSKMKQASLLIADYEPRKKIEWAKCQRQEGNALFEKGNYKEAMDVYLTCLVAMDQTLESEEEIKLPVLLNLALSAIKMGKLSKAHEFCNFAIDTEPGRQSVKSYFRRGSVRMLMGNYSGAESDLNRALELNNAKISEYEDGCDTKNECDMKDVIFREKQKLRRLVNQANKSRRQLGLAMQKVFTSAEDKEMISPTLHDEEQPSCFEWYKHMVSRCAQKLLDLIGDDEEDTAVVVETNQDLLKSSVKEKKL